MKEELCKIDGTRPMYLATKKGLVKLPCKACIRRMLKADRAARQAVVSL